MKTGKLNPNSIKYPTWELVEETTLAAPATTYTFSNLAGNTAEMYMLNFRIIGGYNGSCTFYLRPNNDSGANYGDQEFYGSNTTIACNRSTGNGIWLCSQGATNRVSNNSLIMYAKSGYLRTLLNTTGYDISTTTVYTILINGASWTNTSDEITSLVVVASQANGIGAGSYLALYKKIYST